MDSRGRPLTWGAGEHRRNASHSLGLLKRLGYGAPRGPLRRCVCVLRRRRARTEAATDRRLAPVAILGQHFSGMGCSIGPAAWPCWKPAVFVCFPHASRAGSMHTSEVSLAAFLSSTPFGGWLWCQSCVGCTARPCLGAAPAVPLGVRLFSLSRSVVRLCFLGQLLDIGG